MMTIKKDKAFVFIVNKSYLFALGTMIINLQKTNNNYYDEIVIYYDDLDDTDIKSIKNIEPKTKFIKYDLATWENEHIKITTPNAKSFLDRYSHLAWSKYKIIEQLEFYNKVLYLDVDILIKESISEIFEIDGFAWRSGNNFNLKFGNKVKTEDLKNVPNDTPTPNGGLIYISNLNSKEIKANLEDSKKFLLEHIDKFTGGLDELVFGWISYKNKIPVTQLEPYTYNTFPQMLKPHTKLIHFMGAEKPWNSDIMQTIFPKWFDYYKEWLKNGGSASEKVTEKINHGSFISSVLNQRRWLDFFNKTKFECPKDCRISKDLSKEWLIIEHKNNSYYEFKFNQYLPGYQIGFWINDNYSTNDICLENDINDLVKSNKNFFRCHKDKRGIYIYTDRIYENNIPKAFEYFFKKTSQI